MRYYKGRYDRDGTGRKGWFVGQFMNGLRKTSKFEVKFWKFRRGEKPPHKRKYLKMATECTFILRGRIRGEIDGRSVDLRAGDYVLIPKRIKNNFPITILQDAEGLTIKAPSIRGDKVELDG